VPWRASRAFWWLLLAGALGGALAEIALIVGARVILHRYTMLNPQGVWLAPIANALVLLVPLGVVYLVARRWGHAWAIAAVAFVASAVVVAEPLMVLKERLHPAALLVLSIGIATQVSRFSLARPALFARATRALTLAMLVVSVVGGIAFNANRWWSERRAVAALGDAPDESPNVILLVLDTVRALSLGAYGYDRPNTPFLSELAARGVRFDRAISSAPWTLPSHATMFTGRYPHELSAGWADPLDDTYPTLAERLSAQGYLTLGVAANLHYCSYEFGLTRGFARYRDYDVSVSEMMRTSKIAHAAVSLVNSFGGREISPGRQSATRINERLLSLLDARGDRPVFVFANYYDAHGPYNPDPPYDTLYLGRQPSMRDSGIDTFTDADVRDLQAAYDASIAWLDAQLRDLFTRLESRGLLENTLVIVTSDHGEEFNEHGLLNHGSSLYFPSVHVPLLVVHPGSVPAATVVEEPVTLRDLPATILEAVRAPASASLPGESLARWWRGGEDAEGGAGSPLIAEVDYAQNLPKTFAISKGDMKSQVVDGHRYILRGDGHGELFDIRGDPWEQRELTGNAADSARAAALRAAVSRIPRRPPRAR
jgi:arylsulfatase A-like enzyme